MPGRSSAGPSLPGAPWGAHTLGFVTDFADDPHTELERKARALRWVCWAEALGYAGLFAFWVSGNRVGTLVFGSLHGWITMAYWSMVVMITPAMGWGWWYAALVIATGPVGPALVYERLRRHGVPTRYA